MAHEEATTQHTLRPFQTLAQVFRPVCRGVYSTVFTIEVSVSRRVFSWPGSVALVYADVPIADSKITAGKSIIFSVLPRLIRMCGTCLRHAYDTIKSVTTLFAVTARWQYILNYVKRACTSLTNTNLSKNTCRHCGSQNVYWCIVCCYRGARSERALCVHFYSANSTA